MPSQTFNLDNRINTITSLLSKKSEQQLVGGALQAANGDWTIAMESLKDKLPPDTLQKADLAHSLAVLSDDNVAVVKAVAEQPDVNNLRDVALRFNAEKLAAAVDPQAVPADTPGATDEEKKK